MMMITVYLKSGNPADDQIHHKVSFGGGPHKVGVKYQFNCRNSNVHSLQCTRVLFRCAFLDKHTKSHTNSKERAVCIGSLPQQLSYGGKEFAHIHILQPLSASIAASSCSSFLCSWYFKQKPNETLACEKLQQ